MELAALRQATKVHNAAELLKALLEPGYKADCSRVLVFGRLGKNNPNASKYKSARPHGYGFGSSGNYQYIAKADAATLDLYSHPVYNY